jgi:hypothetical protein
MASLHTATDPAGSELFGADTPEAFRRLVFDYLDANPDAVVIECESHRHLARAFPFTLWRRSTMAIGGIVGSMCATRSEALRAIGRV